MTYEEAHRAIKRGDVVRLRSELEGGLNPTLSNRLGSTLLILAAIYGDTQIGRLLIEKGADIDRRGNQGWTALSSAVLAG